MASRRPTPPARASRIEPRLQLGRVQLVERRVGSPRAEHRARLVAEPRDRSLAPLQLHQLGLGERDRAADRQPRRRAWGTLSLTQSIMVCLELGGARGAALSRAGRRHPPATPACTVSRHVGQSPASSLCHAVPRWHHWCHTATGASVASRCAAKAGARAAGALQSVAWPLGYTTAPRETLAGIGGSASVSGRVRRAIRGHLVPRSAPVDPTGGPTGEGCEKVAGGRRRRKPAASDVVHLLGEFGRAACGARGGWLGLRQSEVTCPECRGRGA